MSDWASSNKQRTPSHLSFAASSRVLLWKSGQKGAWGGCSWQILNSPSPVKLVIRPNITVAGVVDYEQMVGSCVLEEGGHLHAELDAGIGHSRDGPSIGPVVVAVSQDVLQGRQVSLDGGVLFPAQQQHGDTVVGCAFRLALYQHGGILKMPRKGLEIMALGGGGLGGRVLLLGLRIQAVNSGIREGGGINELTDSWGNGAGWVVLVDGAGSSFRLFAGWDGCSIYSSCQWGDSLYRSRLKLGCVAVMEGAQ